MKPASPARLLLLATLFAPSAFAAPRVRNWGHRGNKVEATATQGNGPQSAVNTAQSTKSTGGTLHHNGDGATVTKSGDTNSTSSGSGQKCISFTSDDSSWSFANTGVWGSQSGTFASAGGKICVPENDSAGGAMYIGSGSNPGSGNTKLECFFPSSGDGNCDVSLVDGYSLSVTCQATGAQTIGGSVNLWNQGSCPSGASQGFCPNANGADESTNQDGVAEFFQPAVQGGNNYCIVWNCDQDYSFSNDADVSCHVSGGSGSGGSSGSK